MRSHADVDPNAPPALKASPSASGSDEGHSYLSTILLVSRVASGSSLTKDLAHAYRLPTAPAAVRLALLDVV